MIVVYIYVFFLILLGVTFLAKGNYHHQYLRRIFPLNKTFTSTYFSSFTFDYNGKTQFLGLPYFKRYKNREDEISRILYKRTMILMVLNIISILAVIMPMLLACFDINCFTVN